jgi:hypothetical protein
VAAIAPDARLWILIASSRGGWTRCAAAIAPQCGANLALSSSNHPCLMNGVILILDQNMLTARSALAVSFLALLLTSGCATPSASALQTIPSPTSYWSFLWPVQTAWQTPAPPPTYSSATSDAVVPSPSATSSSAPTLTPTETPSPMPTETPLPSPTDTPLPTATLQVTKLKATVTAGLLSCRYGPGPEYLYLYALRQGANITLIGRTDGDNWHWAWVEGRSRCWVNTSYLKIDGDWRQLPIVYPGGARIPVSPYYSPPRLVSVVRVGNSVTVEWAPMRLRAGDEEDESMLLYVLEVWRCQGGQLVFEPLATNDTMLTVVDEPGCGAPSHARLFFQEKHGFAGPSEVPWPSW